MNNFSPREILLQLSLIEGVGPATIQSILQHKPQDLLLKDLSLLSLHDWQHYFGFTQKKAKMLYDGLLSDRCVVQELSLLQKYKVTCLTVLDEDYPILLKNIFVSPPILYVWGAPLTSEKSLGVVGARRANQYARNVLEDLIPSMVSSGWTIVSGGALGADSMAHSITLKNGGKTVAVLGSGLLKPYPRENNRLFKDIVAKGGTLVSSFSLQATARPGNFPARNRIISGLSRGCLVVQAGQKSGALITAKYALDQSREVFAIPGDIHDPLSIGCHALIQEGAKLVTCIEDILQEFGEKPSLNTNFVQVSTIQENAIDPIHKKILAICKKPCSFDDLLLGLEVHADQLQSKLFELQIEGNIAQDFSGKWLAQ